MSTQPVDVPLDFHAMATVLDQVANERYCQHAKFKQQNWPDGTGTLLDLNIARARTPLSASDAAKDVTNQAFADGKLTWKDILVEELFEALDETDLERLRAEVIQVAGVAVAWVEAIDRRIAAELQVAETGGGRTIHDAADDLVRATH